MKLRYNDEIHAYWLNGQRCKGVTGVAKVPDNTYYLDLWQKRMVAIGLASEPRLIQQVAAHLGDKNELDKICEKAQKEAKAHHAAEDGQTAHKFTEAFDLGEAMLDTELGRQIIATWNACISSAGYEVVDGLIERIVVHPDRMIAGKFDRILRRRTDGRLFIADLKTGQKAIDYPHSIAVQEALYANAPLLAGRINGTGETTQFDPFPDVDKNIGIVIHMPAPDQAELVEFDIAAGWQCFLNIIEPTYTWRARHDLTRTPTVEPPAPAPEGQTAGTEDATVPAVTLDARRNWLIERIMVLNPAGRTWLGQHWPDGIPTFKQQQFHTVNELNLIEGRIVQAEAEVDAPFVALPVELVELMASPMGAAIQGPVTVLGSIRSILDPDDEGPDVSPTQLEDARRGYEEHKPTLDRWAKAVQRDGGRSLNLKQRPSRWRWTVLQALIACARAKVDDEALRDLIHLASNEALEEADPLGRFIADLTIPEAERLTELAHQFDNGQLDMIFNADGTTQITQPTRRQQTS